MVKENERKCPKCGGDLKHYDTVNRRILTKGRTAKKIYVEKLRCCNCGSYHNVIPEMIFPYKHYDAEIIQGVLEGFITPDTLGFEDYPCELTMKNWLDFPPSSF